MEHPEQIGALARTITEMLEDTGYLPVSVRDIAEATGAPLAIVEAAARARPGPRPARRRSTQSRRMPRPAGQGGRPLRSRNGAADRQSRPSRQGPHGGPQADLRRRRRGPCGHGARAARLRSEARLPIFGKGMESVTPDVFIRRTRSGYAVELNTATLPRLLVNRRYYQELEDRTERQELARPGSANAWPAPTGWSRRSTSARAPSSRSSARS